MGYDVFKNKTFSEKEWTAIWSDDPEEIRLELAKMKIEGMTITHFKLVGLCYNYRRDDVEEIAYGYFEGYRESNRQKLSDYDNIPSFVPYNRWAEVDGPMIINLADEDEDEGYTDGFDLEIEAPRVTEYRFSKDKFPYGIKAGVNLPNIDANILFEPCLGKRIEYVEVETFKADKDPMYDTEYGQERELVSCIILRLEDGTGLKISGWVDFCHIDYVDQNNEVICAPFEDIKPGLQNQEDIYEDESIDLYNVNRTFFLGPKGYYAAESPYMTLYTPSTVKKLRIANDDFHIFDWSISLATGEAFDEFEIYDFSAREWNSILETAEELLSYESFDDLYDRLINSHIKWPNGNEVFPWDVNHNGALFWRKREFFKRQVSDMKRWTSAVLKEGEEMTVKGMFGGFYSYIWPDSRQLKYARENTVPDELTMINRVARFFTHGEAREQSRWMTQDCTYRSDYSGKELDCAMEIVESTEAVDAVEGYENDYYYRVVDMGDILIGNNPLRADRDSFVNKYAALLYRFASDLPVAVITIRQNKADSKINRILLSRDTNAFDTAFYEDEIYGVSEHDVPETIFRDDDGDCFVWEEADKYFSALLGQKGFHVHEKRTFKDCVGYRCAKMARWYTIYMFAYGDGQSVPIEGKFFEKVLTYDFSKDTIVRVSCVNVRRFRNRDEVIYRIGSINGTGEAPELWSIYYIDSTPVLKYEPAEHVLNAMDKFAYAFNNHDYEMYDVIFKASDMDGRRLPDQPVLTDEVGDHEFSRYLYFLNSNALTLHEEYGDLKWGLFSSNGEIYFKAPYLSGYGYFSFRVENSEKIRHIEIQPIDESVAAFHELEVHDPADDLDLVTIVSMEILPPVKTERFAMLLTYDNGKQIKYVLPVKRQEDEAVYYAGHVFTDKIWGTAKLISPNPSRFEKYDHIRSAVSFDNGYVLYGMKCYYEGTEYVGVQRCHEVVYKDDEIEVSKRFQSLQSRLSSRYNIGEESQSIILEVIREMAGILAKEAPMRLKNILIVVSDIERSKKFYSEVFGLLPVLDSGGNVILTEGLVLQQEQPWKEALGRDIIPENNCTELYFETPDLEGFIENLENLYPNIQYVSPLATGSWDRQVVRFYDPDGNLIEVGEQA